MKWEGTIETGGPVYDPLEPGPVTAARPNRYNEVTNLVMADRAARQELTPTEQGVLSAALASAGDMISRRQMSHHAGQMDSALGNAWASLLYSLAYGAAFALITAGLVLTVWMLSGGDEAYYALAWFVLWGVCCLAALAYNRWQGLHHSPAGLGHHEIESREKVAIHAIDRYTELISLRLQLKAKENAPVVEAKGWRRLLG